MGLRVLYTLKIVKHRLHVWCQDRGENKHEDHLSSIRTGQVQEKRNFWMRSTSADRVATSTPGLSPAPRRRRLDWSAAAANRQREAEEGPESRPGSSLGAAANTGSVRNLTSGFLAKSKSSAAVMQDEVVAERGRPKHKTLIQNGWTKEKYDQEMKQEFFKSQELKTNKVNDTVQTWGKKDSGAVSGRTTPTPSRNIGEVFSENKIGRGASVETKTTAAAAANSWRTKTPEPTLKLVNVSVEKSPSSGQNIHISENAQRQMASFISESRASKEAVTVLSSAQSCVMTNTLSSQSSSASQRLSNMSTSSKRSSGEVHVRSPSSFIEPQPQQQQPPLAPAVPERNQSFGGKCVETENTLTSAQEPEHTLAGVSEEAKATTEKVASGCGDDAGVQSVPPVPANPSLQSSASAQSINSVLSTCSSGALPEPVRAGWFDEMAPPSPASPAPQPPAPLDTAPPPPSPPKLNGKTPVPIVANWFENLEAKFSSKPKPARNEAERSENVGGTIQAATSDLDDILDELIIADMELKSNENQGRCDSAQKIFLTDDADNMSIKSDVTVIENQNVIPQDDDQSLQSLQNVPQSPKEIRKKFQSASSFEKSFTKSSDIELSKEFKAGVKGKVSETRENFLRQITQTQNCKALDNKCTSDELQQLKLQRAMSQGKLDTAENTKPDKHLDFEPEVVNRSTRAKSRTADEPEDIVQSSYCQEKRERELELLQLANRNTNMSWQPEVPEPELRNDTNRFIECFDASEDRAYLLQEENSQMWMKDEEEMDEDDADLTDVELSQQIWNERAEELRQIAQLRPKSPWRPQSRNSPGPGKLRNTAAAAWRDRGQKSASRDRDSPAQLRGNGLAASAGQKTPTPTRRIGSLFNRDPDYWNLNDDVADSAAEFPEPPSGELVSLSPTPPTPQRQSSRGKIEEYAGSGGWRRC